MKFVSVICFIALFSAGVLANPSISFSEMANRSVDAVWFDLETEGLEKWDAYHPHLPRPQVPAKFAVVNKHHRVLAYFDEEYGYGAGTFVFKNPNGGLRHSVSYAWEGIKYVTPYAGNVAHANQFMTVSGPGYHFHCRSQYVGFPGFQKCIDFHWVQVIVKQLTRYR